MKWQCLASCLFAHILLCLTFLVFFSCLSSIIIQGQSSLHPTDMDVDDNPSKDEEAEAYNKMDDEPSSSSKQNQSNADDLRNNIPNWTGYNLRTPDLNDMLFHNEDDAGPSSSYYQPSPFPCDDRSSIHPHSKKPTFSQSSWAPRTWPIFPRGSMTCGPRVHSRPRSCCVFRCTCVHHLVRPSACVR